MVVGYLMLCVLSLTSLTDGFPQRARRFLLYNNPSDMSTAIGYQNHVVHNMTSLVDEVSIESHTKGGNQTSTGSGSEYNVPNFPAMGKNNGDSRTGSSSVTSGSASFAGTNHWRCDFHVMTSCDIQCLDVDPKDGCPFCIPSCHASAQTGQPGTGQSVTSAQSASSPFASGQSAPSAFASGQSASSPFASGQSASSPFASGQSAPSSFASGQSMPSPFASGQSMPSPFAIGQSASSPFAVGQSGIPTQVPASQSGKHDTSGTSVTATPAACPFYPPNCPLVYTKLEKGCLVCTILKLIASVSPTKAPTTVPVTSLPLPQSCAPKRCIPPCDKGIVLDATGCPQCLCPHHV